MPIYEYRCDNGHTFEATQRMSDDPLISCSNCEAPVQRVFHPIAVHFKGSGFYNTDYGRKGQGGGEDASAGKEDKKPAESGKKPAESGKKPASDSKAASAD
jgi:putative FmdB family regulatory protein